MPEFVGALNQTRTVILPFGALEEHGPHLPLSTDTLHALELARQVAQRVPIMVAPPIHYGVCRSTREHPGTISLSGDTLRALARDLGRDFYRQGVRQFIMLTGHCGGTHIAALIEAGEALMAELADLKVAVVNIIDLLLEVLKENPSLVRTKGDSHAGEVETALMQAAYPHLVKGTAAEEWPHFPKFILVRDKQSYWPGGVWGNPELASPEQGRQLLAREADYLAELVKSLETLSG
ncbi:MAG: creatininase family protein [Desulfobacca sp.]|nr:creatininase family protein [Desulfobacca sp.]